MSIAEKAVLVVLCAIYVFCPLDGDFIPILGWLDDMFVIWLTYKKVTEPSHGNPPAVTIDHVG